MSSILLIENRKAPNFFQHEILTAWLSVQIRINIRWSMIIFAVFFFNVFNIEKLEGEKRKQ